MAAKVLIFALLFSLPAFAQDDTIAEPSAEEFSRWVESFKKTARKKHKISEATLSAAFRDVKWERRIIEADRRQPEFVRTFWSYYDSALSQDRIANGKLAMETHARLLENVSRKYNVQPHILVAFWGMETNYGRNMGGHGVISALSTLSFDERRREFFTEELVHALKILEAGHVKLVDFKGSWAGAFGNFQFLPSTFAKHAVDGDGDGRIDVYGNVADSLSSAANYLSKMGWDGRYKWGRAVSFPQSDMEVWKRVNSAEREDIGLFASLGVRTYGGSELPKSDIKAMLVAPGGAYMPVFMVYDNYKIIMRWNASANYAISVGLLSDAIVAKSIVLFEREPGWDTAMLPVSKLKEIQQALKDLGVYDAKISGIYGGRTIKAIKSYQAMLLERKKTRYKTGRPIIPDGYPSIELYEFLTGK